MIFPPNHFYLFFLSLYKLSQKFCSVNKMDGLSGRYLAISHLLTSRPRLGMYPMPLWGSLVEKVLR